jgi:hypothetical protein
MQPDKLIEIFKKAKNILEEHDIDYWIEYGTLLGYIRDKKLIDWDVDVDIAIKENEFKKIIKLIPHFREIGFNVRFKWRNSKRITKIIQLYTDNIGVGYHVDLYEFKTQNGKPYRMEISKNNIFARKISNFRDLIPTCNIVDSVLLIILEFCSLQKTLIFPETETTITGFYDTTVRIPINAEEHLCFLYGNNWRIPDRGYCDGKHAGLNATRFRDKKRWICESYVSDET